MARATRIEINTGALAENLRRLKVVNGADFFCPMIKANAYGHGVDIVAPVVAAAGADMVGVALLEEGLHLRRLGLPMPILVFAPVEKGDASLYVEERLTPVVARFADLDELESLPRGAPLGIHVKFNTGMQRLGFDAADITRLRQRLESQPRFKVEGVCTHLTHGEDVLLSDGPSAEQFRKFIAMAEGFPGIRHAHKSSSLAVMGAEKVFPGVGARPGISIYGLPHDADRTGAGLKPVLTWKSQLTNVHLIEPGAAVSYGARWVAPRRSWIGVVPFGYGDGYSRSLSNKGQMLFRGVKVPVAGSVCMDYTLLDLTEACADGPPTAGEEIVVIGRQGAAEISAAEIAALSGTIAYEVVTSISGRVARIAV